MYNSNLLFCPECLRTIESIEHFKFCKVDLQRLVNVGFLTTEEKKIIEEERKNEFSN